MTLIIILIILAIHFTKKSVEIRVFKCFIDLQYKYILKLENYINKSNCFSITFLIIF